MKFKELLQTYGELYPTKVEKVEFALKTDSIDQNARQFVTITNDAYTLQGHHWSHRRQYYSIL